MSRHRSLPGTLKGQQSRGGGRTSDLGAAPPVCRSCGSAALQGSGSSSCLGFSEHPGPGGGGGGGVRLWIGSSLSERREAATGAGGAAICPSRDESLSIHVG